MGVAGVAAISFWAWHGHPGGGQNQKFTNAGANTGLVLHLPAAQTIPLNPSGSTESSDGGLSVSTDSSVSRLGQLNDAQKSAKSGSGNASSGVLDPSTFAQYDKYKDGNSGLFGEVQTGNGSQLTVNHKAAVYYKGWLTNGQLFDESRADASGKLQPLIFTLGEHKLIPGFEEGVNGMKVGGTRLIIVPPAVGYGAAGQGPVPGNAVLIFEVQLLEVQ